MDQSMLDRINALAKKSKAEGLTPAEQEEQTKLRDAYRAAFRRNLTGVLEQTVIVDENGTVIRRVADAVHSANETKN